MSLKRALETLKGLGLTKTDAQTYVYIAKKGPCKDDELSFALNISKPHLHLILKNLTDKHMICAIPEKSIKYSANLFEKVLNDFMKQTKQQAKTLQTRRAELLSTWHSIIDDSSNI